jgi:hypothetical protein
LFPDKGFKTRGKRIKLNADELKVDYSYNRANLRNNSAGGSESPAYSDYSEPTRVTVKSNRR